MAEKVQVGFACCSGIAVAHLKALVKNPHVKLHAFCDINLDRANRVAGQYGADDAEAFDEAAGMFKNAKLDAAYFCLPLFALWPKTASAGMQWIRA